MSDSASNSHEALVIHQLFSRVASSVPDKVALQIKREGLWQRFTYKEIEALALKVGAFLIRAGLRKTDNVGLILENRPEWAVIYLGIMYAGLACVPIDIQLPDDELRNILNDCQARIIFTSHNLFLTKINPEIRSRLHKIVILDADKEGDSIVAFSKILERKDEKISWPNVSAADTASLIYTSGTTASPKGVILSHGNLCSNFRSINTLRICLPCDNLLSILPLHHTYPFTVTLLTPLLLGAQATYCASFKPEELTNIINEAQVTILVGVPQLFALLYKAISTKLQRIPSIFRFLLGPILRIKVRKSLGKSLRLFVSGGARLPPDVAKGLYNMGIKVIEGYGLTETSPVVSLNPPHKVKFGSVGKPVPDVEVKILDPDRAGVGEVLIKGPNVMQGYFRREDLTAEVLRGGWFHSGDLGYFDKEGYLFLTGRAKDVIVLSSGKNIYPEELEEVFLSQSPYIKEMCILSATEEKFGKESDSLYAVIVPNLEYFRQKNEINVHEKIRWELENISKKLASYQHIMGFCVAKDELPRTLLKKVKRYQVRQMYSPEVICSEEKREKPLSAEDASLLKAELSQKILAYLSGELKKKVYLDSHLEIDLGIDSLSRVELGLGLEALLKMHIPSRITEKAFTVKELILSLQEIITYPELSESKPGEEERKTWPQILKDDPPAEVRDKIRLYAGFFENFLTFVFKSAFWLGLKAFWFLKIEGRQRIPKHGPYIFCSNHASYLDGFVLFSSIPFNSAANIFFLGHAKIFEHPLIAWAIKLARLIPIDPAVHLTPAMQACSFVLAHQKNICIFPEGSRSISTELGNFKKGIAILAKELNIPVIPVYIQGSHYSWPRGTKFPRPYPLKIIFGKPVRWQDFGDDYAAITQGLRKEVLKLRP
jgi:long-chain acyl-CoA synthetase